MSYRKHYFCVEMLFHILFVAVGIFPLVIGINNDNFIAFLVCMAASIGFIALGIISFSITLYNRIKYWSTMIYYTHSYMIRTDGLSEESNSIVKEWVKDTVDPIEYVKDKIKVYKENFVIAADDIGLSAFLGDVNIGKDIDFLYITIKPFGEIKRKLKDGSYEVVNGLYDISENCCYISFNSPKVMTSLMIHETAHAILDTTEFIDHVIMEKAGIN